jgi:hypothetical protein
MRGRHGENTFCRTPNYRVNYTDLSTTTKYDVETVSKKYDVENKTKKKVPPRFELGLLDSESNVLTTRPWDPDV